MKRYAWVFATGLFGAQLAHAQPGRASKIGPARVKEMKTCVAPAWAEDLWPDPTAVSFEPTTLEEKRVFSELIPLLLELAERGGALPEKAVALARRAEFLLEERAAPDGGALWVLRELPARRRGAGTYVLRTGPATQDVVQAPHAYFDLGTGALGAALFTCAPEARRPRFFATNSAHRYGSRPGEKPGEGDHPADVAHNSNHLFQWVTDLLAQRLPRLRVIQLHGFGRVRADHDLVHAVVSAGKQEPSDGARRAALRLTPVLGSGVRLFPEQTQQLGGTRNVQARLLQSYPSATFVHLELSAHARKSLSSPDSVTRAADALFAPEGG
jgi:hypothetical protein